MPKRKVTPLLKESYLAVIKNSVGVKTWQNLYAKVNGQKKDITQAGVLSCAFFVSSVLLIFGLIDEIHATVTGTVKDLEKSGWQKIKKPKEGCVIVWEKKQSDDDFHTHIGFYVSPNEAISNDSKLGFPKVHHFTYGQVKGQPVRKIIASYWHKRLNK